MTKKKPPGESDSEQIKRFEKAVRDLEAAGELSRTDADAALERMVGKVKTKPSPL